MTKQAKIAQQIKRYIRQVADADDINVLLNSREWKEYVSLVNKKDAILWKEYTSLMDKLKQRMEEEEDPKRKRKIKKLRNALFNEAFKMKLYDLGSVADNLIRHMKEKALPFSYKHDVAEWVRNVKNANPVRVLGASRFYVRAYKPALEFIKTGVLK